MIKAYEQIYKKIYHLVPELDKLEAGDGLKLKSKGFMDLNIDVLARGKDTSIIAMSHYYRHPSGDQVADPDMEIKIHHKSKMAEALSYQDSLGYRQVYPEEGLVNPQAKKDLNDFLNQWLNNIKGQGHKIEGDEGKDGRGR